MFYRPRSWREAAPPPPTPASTAMLASETSFVDRPFGSHGEVSIVSQVSEPPPEPSRELLIEPPDWGDLDVTALTPQPQRDELDALSALRLGHDDFDPPPPGPVMVTPPLVRFVPPPADWRLEETLRTEQTVVELQSPGALVQRPAAKGRTYPGMP